MAVKKKAAKPHYIFENPWAVLPGAPTQEGINLATDVAEAPVAMEAPIAAPVVMDPRPGAKLQAAQLEMPVVGGAPGDFGKNELTAAIEKKLGRTENLYMTPEQNTALWEAAGEVPEVQSQKNLLRARAELAKDTLAATPTDQMDYTPLLALADTWAKGKSNLASSYRRPAGTQDKAKMMLDFADKQSDDQQRLYESMAKNVALMKSGTTTEGSIDKLGELLSQGRNVPKPSTGGGRGRSDLLADRFLRGYRSLPNVQDAQKGLTAANEVAGFLANPNWLTDAAAKGNILQAMRMYPISDRDAALVGGSGDVASRANRLTERLLEGGSFTEEDRGTIMDYAKVLQRSKAAVLKQTADEYVGGLGPEFGYDSGKGQAILAPSIPKVTDPQIKTEPSLKDLFKQFQESKRKK